MIKTVLLPFASVLSYYNYNCFAVCSFSQVWYVTAVLFIWNALNHYNVQSQTKGVKILKLSQMVIFLLTPGFPLSLLLLTDSTIGNMKFLIFVSYNDHIQWPAILADHYISISV